MSLGIRLDAEGAVKGISGCAEAFHRGKSSYIQALPLSCPPLPSWKSGGAVLASAQSRLGIPNASGEE